MKLTGNALNWQKDLLPAIKLAVASLSFLENGSGREQIRKAVIKASFALDSSKKIEMLVKKQAEKILECFIDASQKNSNLFSSFFEEFDLPFEVGQKDTEIARFIVWIYIFQNSELLPFKCVFNELSGFMDNRELLFRWFYKSVISKSLQCVLAILHFYNDRQKGNKNFRQKALQEQNNHDIVEGSLLQNFIKNNISLSSSIEEPVNEFLSSSGTVEGSLVWLLAKNLSQALILSQPNLNLCLDRFLSLSHMPSPSQEERTFLQLALFLHTWGTINPSFIKAGLEQNQPLGMQPKIRKFLARGLQKACNSLARELAFQALYAFYFDWPANERQLKILFGLTYPNEKVFAPLDMEKRPSKALELVLGVWKQAALFDEEIEKYSHKWKIARMGKLELILLRLGFLEISVHKIPPRVIISEILELADKFGVSEAKSLVNGILDAAMKASNREFD